MANRNNTTTIVPPAGGVGYYLSISWTENSTSVKDNTSNITATATMSPVSSGMAFSSSGAGVLRAYWHDNKDNTDKLVAELAFNELGYNTWSRTASGSINVEHKSDGTLKGYAKATWTKGSSSAYVPGTSSVQTPEDDLTTIARKSTPTVTPEEISIPATSGIITVLTNRKSTVFTHTVELKVGNTVIATETGVADSATFNIADIDEDILETIPSATSATVTVKCTTYSGSTSIGDASVNLTAKVNDNAAPTFANFTYQDTNSTITAITGNNQYIVSGKSTLTVKISTSQKATANYSATMSQYTMAINNVSQNQPYTTAAITKSLGTVTLDAQQITNTTRDLVVTAIDSRGKSTAVTKAVTIVPYAAPIVNASATRENGFDEDTTISISGTFSRVVVGNTAKNTVSTTAGVEYRFKLSTSTTWGNWTAKTATVSTTDGTVTVADFVETLDNDQAFDFQFRITDRLETTTISLQVPVGQPAFFIGEDGSIGVGGMPTIPKLSGEQGVLDVKGRIFSNGQEVLPGGGDLPDNIVLWDDPSTIEPETPWVTKSMIDFDSFGIFSNNIAITNGNVRVARFGKFGIILGISTNFTYTGTYKYATVTVPTSVLPAGSAILQTQATTCNHTVDDNQWTHGIGSMTAGASGTTLGFPLLAGNSASKSCAVAFEIFFIEQ